MKPYDFIIAGGGAAGLSLLLKILRSDLKDRSVLLVDREQKTQNDRTWCFWSDRPTGLEDIYYRSWNRIRFTSDTFNSVLPLGRFSYAMIRGIDFYRHAFETARQYPNVTILQGSVAQVQEYEKTVSINVDGKDYHGKFLFDSILRLGEIKPDPTRFHQLKQHFYGWEIDTCNPIFDPQAPSLFDFRTPQNGAMRFMYILPFSPQRALVEYTLFSPNVLSQSEYEAGLKNYLTNHFHLSDYQVIGCEQGVIPMTDAPFPRQGGKRILNIGTKGGRVKPSTGYAFWRIQQDSDAIVDSLLRFDHPFQLIGPPERYRLFDSILLQIMLRHPEDCSGLFTAMFKNNSIERLFQFLNESGPVWNDLRVILSLPPYRFLEALLKLIIHKI